MQPKILLAFLLPVTGYGSRLPFFRFPNNYCLAMGITGNLPILPWIIDKKA
jgi:hypothetical protein